MKVSHKTPYLQKGWANHDSIKTLTDDSLLLVNPRTPQETEEVFGEKCNFTLDHVFADPGQHPL